MKGPRQGRNGERINHSSLTRLYQLAQLDSQRPSNKGGWLKVLDMLMNHPDFQPPRSGKA